MIGVEEYVSPPEEDDIPSLSKVPNRDIESFGAIRYVDGEEEKKEGEGETASDVNKAASLTSQPSAAKMPDPLELHAKFPALRSNPIRESMTKRLLSPTKSNKRFSSIEKLTINKLKYDRVGVVGRENESRILKECLDQLNNNKELIFIQGYSGTGKSSLVSTLEKQVSHGGVYVQGKFDLLSNDVPYSGIATAFGALCKKIKNTLGSNESWIDGDDLLTRLGKELSSNLGSSATRLLTMIIPELQALLPREEENTTRASFSESHGFEAGQERWKYSFRVLTRVLGSYCSPMVLVLDDLQWADFSSLEVIDYLMADVQNTNALMIIGCFRSNEVDDEHILSKKIEALETKKDKHGFQITHMELGSLEIEDINKVTMSLLSIDDGPSTQRLTEICYKRTSGNPFFFIEFITMLMEEELIIFNLGLLKWTWDEKAIEDATMSTANVVDMLQARMRKLEPDLQLLLQYAASLGSTFAYSMIDLLWTRHAINDSTSKSDSLVGLFDALEADNFIESCGSYQYRWVHDKVQEAAMTLGDVGKTLFQFEIGAVLYHSLSDEELEESLFDVVDLINKGQVKRRSEFAELNLRAAEKARSISAFHSASKYVSRGIELLPNYKWRDRRELTLRLYTVGAEMELAVGRVETMEMYCNEVLSQSTCSTLDKIPLYIAILHKLTVIEMKYNEAIKFGLSVLKALDCKLISKRAMVPIQAISSLIRTIKKVTNTPRDVYCNLDPMTDSIHKATMLILSRLAVASYLSASKRCKFIFILCITRMAHMTLNYGVCEKSAGSTFGSLGLLCGAMGNFEASLFMGEIANLLQQKIQSKHQETITLYVSNKSIFPWTKPLQSCLISLSKAYTLGMQSGNIEFAMYALQNTLFLPYQVGKKLSLVETKCASSLSQIEDLKQEESAQFFRMFWQMLLNLMGKSNETRRLKGHVFDCDEFVCTSPLKEVTVNYHKMNLLVFFGDFEEAANLAIRTGENYKKTCKSIFECMIETFHRGVALYAMARKTRKRKYRSRANKIRKTMKMWMENGNPNVNHYFSLLTAEQAALDKDYVTTEARYRESIVLAARTGHLQDAALANERYADFLFTDLSDTEGAKYRIEEATRLYRDWGAMAKVEILEKSHCPLSYAL